MSMNEQAINNIMEGVIKGVIEQLKAEAPQVSVSTGSSEPIPVE
ncbi:MAG TPA: propanediol utilization protein, partial [Desulfovibrio sp.]|nr:propanediol utilization protein [Desulfovibrio sp.]